MAGLSLGIKDLIIVRGPAIFGLLFSIFDREVPMRVPAAALALLLAAPLPFGARAANAPLLMPLSQMKDQALVDGFVDCAQSSDYSRASHELLVRGWTPVIVSRLSYYLRKGTPGEKERAGSIALQLAPGFVPYALGALKSPRDGDSVLRAVDLVREAGDPRAIPALRALMKDPASKHLKDRRGRLLGPDLLAALCACKDFGSLPALEKQADAMTGDDRISAYDALARAGSPRAKEALRGFFSGKLKPNQVSWGISLLYGLGDPEDLPLLESLVAQDKRNPHSPYDEDNFTSDVDDFMLATFSAPPEDKARTLASFFKAKHEWIEVMAIQQLGRLGTPEALRLIKTRLNDPWLNIQDEAIKALRKNGLTISRQVDGWNETLRAQGPPSP